MPSPNDYTIVDFHRYCNAFTTINDYKIGGGCDDDDDNDASDLIVQDRARQTFDKINNKYTKLNVPHHKQ